MTLPNAFRTFSLIASDFLGKQSAKWPVQRSKQMQIQSRMDLSVAGLLCLWVGAALVSG